MKQTRPKNLNLFTIRFPVMAIVSILHRVTGAFLFLLIPFLLWSLQYSLTDTGFEAIQQWMDTIYFKLLVWILFIPLCFHLVAGVRHLFSDIHIGDTLKLGRKMAYMTFIVTAIIVLLAGIWLW